MLKAVPQIEKAPVIANKSAIHYGYVAYHDIALGHQLVQPDHSPYYHVIPCRELIPFVSIEVGEIDEKQVQNPKRKKGVPPVKRVPKTAYECAFEIETSYSDWAFLILHPLTGFSTDRAFRIFQTIQPFHYKLKDIQRELALAETRIDATSPYKVTYEGESVELQPLDKEDKAVARKVLEVISRSADLGVETAIKVHRNTLTSMTKAFAGGDGKIAPDPLDKILAEELGTELPQLVAAEKARSEKEAQTDEKALRLREIELKEKELALKTQELELLQKEENRRKMEAVRAGRKKEEAEV